MARSEARAQFLADILTTAVEGGINYWARITEYRWQDLPPEQVYAVIQEAIDLDNEEYGPETRLTVDTIARGIGQIKKAQFRISPTIKADILADDRDNDAGNIDADAADCIVQAAIFGQLVYG